MQDANEFLAVQQARTQVHAGESFMKAWSVLHLESASARPMRFRFQMKPKHHMWQHCIHFAAASRRNPRAFWCYRHELCWHDVSHCGTRSCCHCEPPSAGKTALDTAGLVLHFHFEAAWAWEATPLQEGRVAGVARRAGHSGPGNRSVCGGTLAHDFARCAGALRVENVSATTQRGCAATGT